LAGKGSRSRIECTADFMSAHWNTVLAARPSVAITRVFVVAGSVRMGWPTITVSSPAPTPTKLKGCPWVATQTFFVAIGNSDDKLTQAEWAEFCDDVVSLIDWQTEDNAGRIHGIWYSAPASPFQNMCICFELFDWWHEDEPDVNKPLTHVAASLKKRLAEIGRTYRQESIAWSPSASTEFL
jgi:hypothetical protein